METNQNPQKRNVKKTSRYLAMSILERTDKTGSYSNLLINEAIQKNKLNAADARLLTELVYGVLQRKLTLDFYLSPFLNEDKKIDAWVRNLLRLSIYQMIYLDKIPAHAILFEAVEVAKKKGHIGISKFINGVLRSAERKGFPDTETISDPIERLSIELSMPRWLVEKFTADIGLEETKHLGESLLRPSHSSARVNGKFLTVDEALEAMEEEGFDVRESVISPVGIVSDGGHFASSPLFQSGQLTIQDESSQLVAPALQIEPHHQVLDACAAPGGKTTHIASYLSAEEGGKVTALDLHEHKVALITENAKRMHVEDVVTAMKLDARNVDQEFSDEQFDRILVDAPCSGLGLMRRKPDIKYTKKEKDLLNLQKVQLGILEQVAPKLKVGGLLVYSTCTIANEENKDTIEHFLAAHEEFEKIPVVAAEALSKCVKDGFLQLYPHDFGTDGFFISCVRKIQK
ncbi:MULTISPECIES: 16S rRNA (cytosine(967)-C(5))-methyltransferase RsmB [Carnobacterium]|uniref:16S rRNA (cytosine(967)-C(5))-methyltransferase RsmB n=1 Tax=Carnobacterium TaxID=2747 RepID=UPI0020409C9E|nr:16S rRNA (cytosine(967)-C(5))-methyltransferase RsmB [Carnobacterium inhibens]MCM3512716.1 16S rRNA (cytosine(967)-C(5))-methyltransferase RsmB [Carnobacterium inhibens]